MIVCIPYKNILLVSLLLLMSHDVEQNPGPRPPKYPCGVCDRAVRWNQRGVACDSCDRWYHASCVAMPESVYAALSDTSWHCVNCGLPHFSSSLFTYSEPGVSPLPTPCASPIVGNYHIGTPSYHSSPLYSNRSISHSPSSDPCSPLSISSISTSDTENIPIKASQSLRVLVINFQSLLPKKAELQNLLHSSDPDIILGTETWLKPEIKDAEILPLHFNTYRKDRPDGYGGVLVAVRNTLISHEIHTTKSAECVVVSIQTDINNSPLNIAAVYRPPSVTGSTQVGEILDTISLALPKKDGVLWIGGDLNLPDIDWESGTIGTSNHYSQSLNRVFLDKFSDMGLQQTNGEPTRGDAILDVFLTNRPNLVSRSTVVPGLSDHDILLVDSNIRAMRVKPPQRTIYLWGKANESKIREETDKFSSQFDSSLAVEDIVAVHTQPPLYNARKVRTY